MNNAVCLFACKQNSYPQAIISTTEGAPAPGLFFHPRLGSDSARLFPSILMTQKMQQIGARIIAPIIIINIPLAAFSPGVEPKQYDLPSASGANVSSILYGVDFVPDMQPRLDVPAPFAMAMAAPA